ncbi:MAG: hypothetical protein K2X76_05230 [Sphingomonas sp.]|nr:hypothetical protein [Sphingomonas sp.]
MPNPPSYPGVYVQTLPSGAPAITGVSTAIAGFVGALSRGPVNTPVPCFTFADFEKTFGGLDRTSPTSFQVNQFFLNGGTQAWVSRLAPGAPLTGPAIIGDAQAQTGLHALDAAPVADLLMLPDLPALAPNDYRIAAAGLLAYAQARRAFALIDLPAAVTTPAAAAAWARSVPPRLGPGIINAAAYFPNIVVIDPASPAPMALGPSGTMAGLYALTDQTRGVWKAPAGVTATLAGVDRLAYAMTDTENAALTRLGINALRNFAGYGNVAWGARTLAAASGDWAYLSVRRLALYIEQSLTQSLQWAVFQPNDARLWAQIRASVGGFLQPLFLQGAFVGQTPSQAYRCICDASTTTPADQANGVVNIVISFAPMRPAEFVVITLQQRAGLPSS